MARWDLNPVPRPHQLSFIHLQAHLMLLLSHHSGQINSRGGGGLDGNPRLLLSPHLCIILTYQVSSYTVLDI